MKLFYYVSIAGALSCHTTQQSVTKTITDPVAYANTITETELKEMLYVYASDEFQGRETGKEGEKKAVEFLKNYYKNAKIPPTQAKNAYFQPVPLISYGNPDGNITLNGKNFSMGEQFVTFSPADKFLATYQEIVFAGYGIEDDAYSDYKNIDVTGKVILIMGGEPKNESGTYVITGTSEPSKWSNLRQAINDKIQLAKEKKAAGLLFYDEANFPLISQRFNFMKKNSHGNNMRLKNEEEDAFFYVFINSEMAQQVDKNIGKTTLSKTIPATMKVDFKSETESITSNNVIAYIKGSEKPEEYIIISAHLDHVGVDASGDVFNGADDDGSGTVAVMEIAEAFKKAQSEGKGPKRSVVFLHVTGEEKGLFGSDYYTQHPVFPLASTVADLNIDMIGRTDPNRTGGRNYVYLIGSDKLSTELHTLSEEINSKYMKLELDYTYNDENDPNRFYYRSDHYNFAKNNIPVIFYFNGTHEDYHKVTDTPDKIQYDLLANRAKLVFFTAWELANRKSRIKVDKISN